MGYVLPRGSSRYPGPQQNGANYIEKGAKPAPRIPVNLPRPVKIPPPPTQSTPPKQ
jgi:hypothetical protein